MKGEENLAFVICGEVSERSKEHAWKACRLQKGLEGSNPSLSAIIMFMKDSNPGRGLGKQSFPRNLTGVT